MEWEEGGLGTEPHREYPEDKNLFHVGTTHILLIICQPAGVAQLNTQGSKDPSFASYVGHPQSCQGLKGLENINLLHSKSSNRF